MEFLARRHEGTKQNSSWNHEGVAVTALKLPQS